MPFTADIQSGKKRSIDQNKLQRMWVMEIAEQLGETAEYWRAYCKLHFGVPVMRAENELFAAKYDEYIRPLPYETKLAFMAVPLDFPVTRIMNTKQKTAYLDAINRHFAEQGVTLTQPDMRGLDLSGQN